MKKFIAIMLLLSATVISTSIYAHPEEAEALSNSTYSATYNGTSYLPNGYAVKLTGVGFEQIGLLYVYSSINASATVTPYKKTNSVLRSIRIIQRNNAFGFFGVDGFGKVASFDLMQDCEQYTCSIRTFGSELAATVYLDASLTVQVTFDDGTYTITSKKTKKVQR